MGHQVPPRTRAITVARRWAALVAAGLVLGGCYTVPDSRVAARYRSIYVPTLANETFEPGVHTRVTNAVRREFQNGGHLRVMNSEAEADLVLVGAVTAFEVRATSFDDDDNPLQFALTLGGDIRVRERESGEVVWQKTIRATDFYQVRRSTRTAVRARGRADGLSEAAEEFAERVVFDFVDSVW